MLRRAAPPSSHSSASASESHQVPLHAPLYAATPPPRPPHAPDAAVFCQAGAPRGLWGSWVGIVLSGHRGKADRLIAGGEPVSPSAHLSLSPGKAGLKEISSKNRGRHRGAMAFSDHLCFGMAFVYSFFGVTLAISPYTFWGPESPLCYWTVMDEVGPAPAPRAPQPCTALTVRAAWHAWRPGLGLAERGVLWQGFGDRDDLHDNVRALRARPRPPAGRH